MDNKITSDEHFKPYGTIAFMVLLMILTALVWLSVYYVQIERV